MSAEDKRSALGKAPAPGLGQTWMETLWLLVLRFRRFLGDGTGVLMLASALVTLLALFGLTEGALVSPWAAFLRRWLGWGSGLVVLALGVGGFAVLGQKLKDLSLLRWERVLALEVAAFATLALLAVLGGTSVDRAEAGLDGGLIGWGLAEFVGLGVGPIWRLVLLVFLCGGGAVVGLGQGDPLKGWIRRGLEGDVWARATGPGPAEAGVSLAPIRGREKGSSLFDKASRKRSIRLPEEFKKRFRVEPEGKASFTPPARNNRLPPLELLVDEQSSRPDERNINMTAGLIEKAMAEFGIPAKVVGIQVGPTVTQFAVEPGYLERPGTEEEGVRQKVRVSQITALARDLALALSAQRLRIQAPVPGRPYVGIEVPNVRPTVVRLRPILESEAFYRFSSPLTLALGRNVSGEPVVADLASMPHLLIAGTTGSGKSVCIAAFAVCLAMNNSPEDLRLAMIDPKMVELVRFNGLPHLYGRVETDLPRILGVLRWTVAEMDRRYKLLEAMRARDIDSYNRKMRRRREGEPLRRIVLMIDELADLMMTAPEQTEPALVRLAQMARATGIHLILATQRPSTDVVTGLIKANFPARISFATASAVDSRVILDGNGAESLLGRGDMLFLPPEASAPTRVQGVLVSDNEIEQVITFWQKAWSQPEESEPPWQEMLLQEEMQAERDDLIDQAIEVVRSSRRASASLLQRRLRIGYPRAARLIDELEELGIVGPSQGSGREREVLIEADPEEG